MITSFYDYLVFKLMLSRSLLVTPSFKKMVSSGDDLTTITHRSRPNESIEMRERNSLLLFYSSNLDSQLKNWKKDRGFF
jgi:uncharacterized membrane protein (DUF4010 family)